MLPTNRGTKFLAPRNTGGLSVSNRLGTKIPIYPPRNSTNANVMTAGTMGRHANGISTKASSFSVVMLRGSLSGPCRVVSVIAAPSNDLITVMRYGGYASSLGT